MKRSLHGRETLVGNSKASHSETVLLRFVGRVDNCLYRGLAFFSLITLSVWEGKDAEQDALSFGKCMVLMRVRFLF